MSIKEKWQKVKKWCKEHPAELIGLIGGIGGGLTLGAGLLLSKAKDPHETAKMKAVLDCEKSLEEGHSQYALPDWNESYRENWDKVNKFANTLTLEPGEMYIIDDASQYGGEGLEVSHLVYGDGVYPPEEE